MQAAEVKLLEFLDTKTKIELYNVRRGTAKDDIYIPFVFFQKFNKPMSELLFLCFQKYLTKKITLDKAWKTFEKNNKGIHKVFPNLRLQYQGI